MPGINQPVPAALFHYYEESSGPFRSLSDLPIEEAEAVQSQIRLDGNRFASRRSDDYLKIRHELEQRIRGLFIARGGTPQRNTPHYMILGECRWLLDWYLKGRELSIPLADFDPHIVSFTYGDSFPAMRYQDGKPYRGQVYTLDDLPGMVSMYGLPQDWNPEGKLAPERYIEAQVWSDFPVIKTIQRLGNSFNANL